MQKPLVSIIIPLYNEEKMFGQLIERMIKLLDSFAPPTQVVLINDGSKDNTPI
jgi:glycosyltransferase involved in cell wall biosynthesis